MAAAAIQIEDRKYTVDEYLNIVDKTEGKYEFHHGKLVDWSMMAGTSEPHVLIGANLIRRVGNALDGKPCRVYGSDLLIKIANKSKYRFADVSVVCGPTEFDKVDKGRRIAVTNPKVIVEILSDSSEGDDRGKKFEEYRETESLKEYILVSQTKALIEAFKRNDDGSWGILKIVEGLDAILTLQSIGVDVKMSEVYAGVTFPPPPADDEEAIEKPAQGK